MRVKLSENFRAVFYAPFYATHALGFYTSEGVAVDLLRSSAPCCGHDRSARPVNRPLMGRTDASDESEGSRSGLAARLLL
jgi:hypothetical protein